MQFGVWVRKKAGRRAQERAVERHSGVCVPACKGRQHWACEARQPNRMAAHNCVPRAALAWWDGAGVLGSRVTGVLMCLVCLGTQLQACRWTALRACWCAVGVLVC